VVDAVGRVLERGRGAAGAASGRGVLLEVLEMPNRCEFEQAENVTMCARAREGEGKQREGATSMELTQFGIGRYQ
jgi:hypothetical protein